MAFKMIKQEIRCPKCNKLLIKGYSMVFYNIRCTCGHWVSTEDLMRKGIKDSEKVRK